MNTIPARLRFCGVEMLAQHKSVEWPCLTFLELLTEADPVTLLCPSPPSYIQARSKGMDVGRETSKFLEVLAEIAHLIGEWARVRWRRRRLLARPPEVQVKPVIAPHPHSRQLKKRDTLLDADHYSKRRSLEQLTLVVEDPISLQREYVESTRLQVVAQVKENLRELGHGLSSWR